MFFVFCRESNHCLHLQSIYQEFKKKSISFLKFFDFVLKKTIEIGSPAGTCTPNLARIRSVLSLVELLDC
jgi:hypothetical protein